MRLSAYILAVIVLGALMAGCATRSPPRAGISETDNAIGHKTLFPDTTDSQVRAVRAVVPFYVDRHRQIWGVLKEDPRVLVEWDGNQLTAYHMPMVYLHPPLRCLLSDEKERIWLIPEDAERSVLIFDPETRSWRLHNSMRRALEREGADRPDLRFTAVGYMDHWIDPDDLERGRMPSVEELHGQLDPAHVDALKKDWDVEHELSVVRDNMGFYWIVAPDRIFKTGFDHTAELADSGYDRWFAPGHELTRVLFDVRGHAFLETRHPDMPVREYVVIRPGEGAPEMSMDVERHAEDAITVRFVPESGVAAFCLWRLNGGEWKYASVSKPLELQWLPPGRRLLEAVPVDASLTLSPIPVGLSLDVDMDPEAQIGALIEALSDPAQSRRARGVLAERDAEIVRPALERALEGADDEQGAEIRSLLKDIREQ